MMITPAPAFKENLQQLPSIDGLLRIELVDAEGAVVTTIENLPGKQGSLSVYQYLHTAIGRIDAKAAVHGLAIFGEHTEDAKNRPGAHPNIDLLLDIVANDTALTARLVRT